MGFYGKMLNVKRFAFIFWIGFISKVYNEFGPVISSTFPIENHY